METNDKLVAVADEYAEAALALAGEPGASESLLAEWGEVVAMIQSDKSFAGFLASPVIDKERRGEVLEKALRGRISELALNTLLVLNRKGRADLLPLVDERFRLALQEKQNEVDVHVTTAVPLTESHRKRLGEMVTQYTGRKPRFREVVDPLVIAGLRVQVNDMLLDDTAAHHVRNLRHKLFERASRELHKG